MIKDHVGFRERYSSLLNRQSTVDLAALNQIPQHPARQELDLLPLIDEIKRAILQINSDGAPGKGDIPAEPYKAVGPNVLEAFHAVLWSISDEEKMPDDFRGALIVSLFKNKGGQAEWENY